MHNETLRVEARRGRDPSAPFYHALAWRGARALDASVDGAPSAVAAPRQSLVCTYPLDQSAEPAIRAFLGPRTEDLRIATSVRVRTRALRASWTSPLPTFLSRPARRHFGAIAARHAIEWRASNAVPQRVAVFVSKQPHCLFELLRQHAEGRLHCDLALVISNHEDCRALVERFGIGFFCTPFDAAQKAEAETLQHAQLGRHGIDLIVLARYMQILSPGFVARYPHRIINIHHSFLPAFAGAQPYRRAYERGVKFIGATAHFVTDALDCGEIIEQAVTRVADGDDVAALAKKGEALESSVLARALAWQLDNRIAVVDGATCIFL